MSSISSVVTLKAVAVVAVVRLAIPTMDAFDTEPTVNVTEPLVRFPSEPSPLVTESPFDVVKKLSGLLWSSLSTVGTLFPSESNTKTYILSTRFSYSADCAALVMTCSWDTL